MALNIVMGSSSLIEGFPFFEILEDFIDDETLKMPGLPGYGVPASGLRATAQLCIRRYPELLDCDSFLRDRCDLW